MDTQKYVTFILLASFLLLVYDIYFVGRWTIYCKKRKFHQIAYYSVWIVSAIMLILGGYVVIQKLIDPVIDKTTSLIYLIISFWFIPKLFIMPIILSKDLISNIYRFFKNKKAARKIINDKPVSNRRKFLEAAGWGVVAAPFFVYADGLMRTTYNFEINSLSLPFDSLPDSLDGLNIVLISDLHAGSFIDPDVFNKGVVRQINLIKPDLIFITGDWVNFRPEEINAITSGLKALKAEYGIFGCLGNHDHYMGEEDQKQLTDIIRELGIKLLINENDTVEIRGEKIQIAGIDSLNKRHSFGDVDLALQGTRKGLFTIMLSHDPGNWKKYILDKNAVDLTLSGHTHGGQIRLNILGEKFSHMRYLYDQWLGLYQEGDSYLYVNKGIGTFGLPVRIGVRPEITIIKLTKPEKFANL